MQAAVGTSGRAASGASASTRPGRGATAAGAAPRFRLLAGGRAAAASAACAAAAAAPQPRDPEDSRRRVSTAENEEPDMEAEGWQGRVANWDEFWYSADWERAVEEDGPDDEHDAHRPPAPSVARAGALIDQIKGLAKRDDAINLLPFTFFENEEDLYAATPPGSAPSRNPYTSLSDFRAVAEKRRKAELLDGEWRHRQTLRAKFAYPDPYSDERVQDFYAMLGANDWSEEQARGARAAGGRPATPFFRRRAAAALTLSHSLSFVRSPLLRLNPQKKPG
jgi:hypothetical protein